MALITKTTPVIHVKKTNQEEMEVRLLKSNIVNSDAWRGDTELERLEFAMNIEIIRSGVFEDCTSLTSIKFCKSLKRIEANAFAGCTALREVVVPDSLDEVDCWSDLRRVSKTILNNPSSEELADNLKKGYAMDFYYKGEFRPDFWD